MARVLAVVALACALAVCASAAAAAANVPVLAWSSHAGLFDTSSARVGAALSCDDVASQLGDVLDKPGTVVAFLAGELSMEDFSRFGDAYSSAPTGGAFAHLKSALGAAASSIVIPSVSEPSALEDTLAAAAKSRGAETVTVAPATAADARAAVDEAVAKTTAAVVVVLVRLPGPAAVADAAAAKTAFEANDAAMAAVLEAVAARRSSAPVTALLSGRAPSSLQLPLTAPTPELKSERLRRDTSSDSDSSTNKDKQKSRVAQRVLIDNYIWFSTPVLMGAVTLLIVTPPFIIGLYWLFIMQTPDRFADPNDKCLQVAAN